MQSMSSRHSKEFDEVSNEVNKLEEEYFATHPVEKEIDRYAKYFNLYGPIYSSRVNKLSRNGLIRLLNALAKGPLTDSSYHRTREEKEALMIGMKLQEASMFMTLHAAQQQAEASAQALEKANKDIIEVPKTISQEEVKNNE